MQLESEVLTFELLRRDDGPQRRTMLSDATSEQPGRHDDQGPNERRQLARLPAADGCEDERTDKSDDGAVKRPEHDGNGPSDRCCDPRREADHFRRLGIGEDTEDDGFHEQREATEIEEATEIDQVGRLPTSPLASSASTWAASSRSDSTSVGASSASTAR